MEIIKKLSGFLFSALEPFNVGRIVLKKKSKKVFEKGEIPKRKNRLEYKSKYWTLIVYTIETVKGNKRKELERIIKDFFTLLEIAEVIEDKLESFKTLLNLSGNIISDLDIKEVIKRLLLAGLEITGVKHVSILLVENDRSGFAYEMYRSDKKLRTYHSTARMKKGISGRVLKTGKPVLVRDILKLKDVNPTAVKKGRRSLIAVPLLHTNRIIGIFYVDSDLPDAFDQETLERVQFIANHAAIALGNAKLFNEIKKLAERQALLYNLSLSLISSIELKKMLKNLLLQLKKSLGIEYGAIVQYNKEKSMDIPIAWIGYKGLRNMVLPVTTPPDSLVAYAIAYKKMIYAEDVTKNKFYYKMIDEIQSEVAIPLILGEEIVGAMVLSRTVKNGFDQEDLELLLTISSSVAMAIKNAELYEKTRIYAITDPLTGIANRRRLEEIIDREINRSIRYSRMFSLLFIDLDNFKAFNDTYGHTVGDEVLKEFAGLLKSAVRKIDFAGRYGGDEFIVILVETDISKALSTGNRVRKLVQDKMKEYGITISIGVSTYPLHGAKKSQLIQAADNACYRAKKLGGNRVVHP
ncbi:MAG TPA: GGDEF domain-containing protein [bacterium]|nr:GGDEF domain-containing protein [bacterium]